MASARASRSSGVLRTSVETLKNPEHQRGLTSLLSQTYGKPVELNIKEVHQPYHDADILASHVAQQLRDRQKVVRRVLRDATWKAQLPAPSLLAQLQRDRQRRHEAEKPFKLSELTHGASTKTSRVLDELELPQVSSVRVSASGRLSKRMVADQAATKTARRGATDKAPAPYMRGVRKWTITEGTGTGKRRIGAFGVKSFLGHT